MVTVDKEGGKDGGYSSIPRKRVHGTLKLNPSHIHDHDMDPPEREIPPPRSTVSLTHAQQHPSSSGSSTKSSSSELAE
ncbi:hypothetical protein F2Q70_00017145 [Brassica cretica]|uniref:Uncharacterized protein n=1 Tax=Brassica cretica TaxID=69181 RepID=A0A8S9HSQ9_BRACR|nr:hypothetical protein F2Q70_00017145 [Brassica cretica]